MSDRPSISSTDAEEAAFLRSLDQELSAFFADQADVLDSISPETLPLLTAIRELSAGGKKLRALLVYWGARAAGGSADDESTVKAGAAIELFQSAALIHDDIIDHSDTRRGGPSVHKRFENAHREAGWGMEADQYGVMSGIIAGDMCLAHSESVFSSIGSLESSRGTARRIFDLMRTEVIAGQYLDGLSEHIGHEHHEAALRRAKTVIRYKAAKYSCEHPLTLGAALAGGGPELIAGLSEFGLPLGEAFQLRDDLLGIFGEPAKTGKPAGDDLREGKRTALVALTHQGATPEQSTALEAALGTPDLDEDAVESLRRIIVESGGLAKTEALIAEREEQVATALARLPVTPEVREALGSVASRALHRSS